MVSPVINADTFNATDIQAMRLRHWNDSHVRCLNNYVATNNKSGKTMPYFDPLDGGTKARVLILLESPARSGSYPRFVSRDNPSPTQINLKQCLEQSGPTRKDTVLWNAYPWLPNEFGAHRTLSIASIRQGMHALSSVLNILPNIEIAVLAGRVARQAGPVIRRFIPGVEIIETFHPSPSSLCVSKSRRENIIAALKIAKMLVELSKENSSRDD